MDNFSAQLRRRKKVDCWETVRQVLQSYQAGTYSHNWDEDDGDSDGDRMDGSLEEEAMTIVVGLLGKERQKGHQSQR